MPAHSHPEARRETCGSVGFRMLPDFIFLGESADRSCVRGTRSVFWLFPVHSTAGHVSAHRGCDCDHPLLCSGALRAPVSGLRLGPQGLSAAVHVPRSWGPSAVFPTPRGKGKNRSALPACSGKAILSVMSQSLPLPQQTRGSWQWTMAPTGASVSLWPVPGEQMQGHYSSCDPRSPGIWGDNGPCATWAHTCKAFTP